MNSFSCRTEYFKNSSFPYVEWNNLNPEIRSSGSYNIFHKSLLNFIRPSASKVYNINDTIGIKLITRLHLGFSHLPEHKVQHNFQDIKFALFLKHRSRIYISLLSALPGIFKEFHGLRNIDNELPTLGDENLTNILLYGNQIHDHSKRFDKPPFTPS